MKPKKIVIIAGEASGDIIGANLMQSLMNCAALDVEFHGIGGQRMQSIGLHSIAEMKPLSVMGLFEVIPNLFIIKKIMDKSVEYIYKLQPDVVITIDSPGFNFRLVKRLRVLLKDAKYLHYVAPTVWAYKPERVNIVAELYDTLLLILPFEEKYFQDANSGLRVKFVGHPVVEAPEIDVTDDFVSKYQIYLDGCNIVMLPGSRSSEIDRHIPMFANALKNIGGFSKGSINSVLIPSFPSFIGRIKKYTKDLNAKIITNIDEKYQAIKIAKLGLIKSGTSSLELARYGVPMIVAHKMNLFTELYIKRMVKIKYASIANLILNEEVVPEFLMHNFTLQNIEGALRGLICNEHIRVKQIAALATVIEQLKSPSLEKPSNIAAQEVMHLLA